MAMATARDSAWYSYTSSTQTMKTWARALANYEEVPKQFREAFPDDSRTFPYTVLIPEEKFAFLNTRNGKMLCLFDDHFVFLEDSRHGVHSVSSSFEEVHYLEYGKILLHSWLKAESSRGSVNIKFNTVNAAQFDPFLKKIRQHNASFQAESNDDQELEKFLPLNTINYKYMNYGRQSIQSGDRVISMIYQPERCLSSLFTLRSKAYFTQYSGNHLTILTDNELIHIKESSATKRTKKNLYGAIFAYIPLTHIRESTVLTTPEGCHTTLELRLQEGIRQRLDFSNDHPHLEEFQQKLQERIVLNS